MKSYLSQLSKIYLEYNYLKFEYLFDFFDRLYSIHKNKCINKYLVNENKRDSYLQG